MKIAIIGASGYVGSCLLQEGLFRNHEITALSRHPEKIPALARVYSKKTDVYQEKELIQSLAGNDAVLCAFNGGWTNPNLYDDFLRGTKSIISAVKASGIKRIIFVGGAGSLFIAPGKQLVDTPEFPAEYKSGALAAREALKLFQAESVLDWTFVSPAIQLIPGERTGKFRIGDDNVLSDAKGESKISVQDLAVAIFDELELPKFVKRRFTAAY